MQSECKQEMAPVLSKSLPLRQFAPSRSATATPCSDERVPYKRSTLVPSSCSGEIVFASLSGSRSLVLVSKPSNLDNQVWIEVYVPRIVISARIAQYPCSLQFVVEAVMNVTVNPVARSASMDQAR